MNDSNKHERSFKEKRWTKIIEEARAHTEGVASYCRARAISVNTYYGWFKRLRVDHPEWTDLKPQLHRPLASSNVEKPETEVQEKAKRRTFSSAYKSRILLETDSAEKGEVASILRREGLYSSHLHKWRGERERTGLEEKKRGPRVNPFLSENKDLRKKVAKLQKQLEQANDIIEVQKKIAQILGNTLERRDDE